MENYSPIKNIKIPIVVGNRVLVRLFEPIGKALAYGVPERFADKIAVGSLLKVPLRGKSVFAIVSALSVEDFDGKLRDILEMVCENPVLSPKQMQLAQWMANYYALPLEAVLECFLPAAVRNFRRKFTSLYAISPGISSDDFQEKISPRARKKWAVFHFLLNRNGASIGEILRETGASSGILRTLEKAQWIRRLSQRSLRQSYGDDLALAEWKIQRHGIILNANQQKAFAELAEKLSRKTFSAALLHGVTASGKTEIYLRLIENVMRESGSVLYLVPELPQTFQAIARVRSRLESCGINVQGVVWHSGLSEGERFDAWEQLSNGTARLVVGTRSAIFLPLQNLRLVIVDEEHDSAFFQEDFPRYSGRDVAIYRAKLENSLCILGSATPSLESYHNARSGKYDYFTLPERVDGSHFPAIRLVDLGEEARDHRVLSEALEAGVRKRLDRREQIILFLNRRGFSRRICCGHCGHVPFCPRCRIPLVLHLEPALYRCHFCNFRREPFCRCPRCGSSEIHSQGVGTQKLELILRQRFPQIRCARCDGDAFADRHAFRHILQSFQDQQLDLLMGTQMLAKGFDFPNVTLVGIVDGDLSLFAPDFRTAERTFQLLTQMAGRSGRREKMGEVILQTRQPENSAIRAVVNRDETLFYDRELEARQTFGYPPFRRLLRQVFLGESSVDLQSFFGRWSQFLLPALAAIPKTEMRGPIFNEKPDLKGCFRGQLWFLTPNPLALRQFLCRQRQQFPENYQFRHEFFDVDSQNLD